ncbi:MAG: hypothetical protein ACE144_06930 [Thermodesulfobacteriota bacterium]
MKKIERIFSFIVALVMLITVSWAYSFAQVQTKYPPYPDVWGYEFPWPEKNSRNSFINVTKMPDGDYLVTYVRERQKLKRKDGSCCDYISKYEGVSFFSGKIFVEDEYKKRKRENIRVNHNITANGGNIIEQTSIATSGHCTDSFYDYYVIKKDSNKKYLERKMFLYLYDEPQRININKYCERNNSYNKDYFLKKVENMYVKFAPIGDGTFFLYDPEGNVIIRFDEKFNTKSALMNKRVFMIDRSDYEEIYDRQSKEGKIDDQAMNDAISEYLVNLKKEGKK